MNASRRDFLKTASSIPAFLMASSQFSHAASSERPNILWIIGEDLCPDLGCYGNDLVHTPHIDRLAGEGVRFVNAFTTSPVCSASRSAFMTGMYQTSIDTHNHRSHRRDGYQLPDGVNVITEYFRDAGYFTANITKLQQGVNGTGKTDWNFNAKNPFDGNDWDQLKENQPFYAQINFSEAHRTFQNDKEHPINPDEVTVPPYYPDHPIAREDWSQYLETLNHLDRKVGAVLTRLEEDGLADNTIVVFMGDHGRCHVRGKQWLYEGGIHIPLIIRWPEKIKAGQVNDNLISAIDISATSLHFAGIDPPEHMEGQVFWGPNAEERRYIIAARDRCDETVDRIRCVRTKRFKYIRNYHPERPYLQLNRYKEKQYPVLRLMRRLHEQGELTPEQEKLMADRRPKEELYDLRSDPHELYNLADNARYNRVLNRMRSILNNWIHETGDHGVIPEDPEIIEYYRERMKNNYDNQIKKLYEQEGMEFKW